MFRLWAKEFKDNHMLRDIVITGTDPDTRTHKIMNALDDVCHSFNLGRPIWLDNNINDFQKYAKTRFYQDSFIDTIDFDYLEIHVIEED